MYNKTFLKEIVGS